MVADRITLGIEEEYQLCDPVSGDLTPAVDTLLAAAPAPLRERLGHELLHTVLEGNITVAETVDEAVDKMRNVRAAVVSLAEQHGVAIGIGGVHPYARWQDQTFVDTPGYQWVGHQLQYLARRNLSFGLHVHVGVEDDEARVYVANEFRRWCAPLLALSANGPFFERVDTGFQTIRIHVFGSFPRTGFAPEFRDWEHAKWVVERLIASDAITAARQVWWNVRPHLDYGTVELRMLDMQIDLERVRTFTALCQALAWGLIRAQADGTPPTVFETELLKDGWFKAQRFPWNAPVAHPVTGDRTTLAAEIAALREAALPGASALGTVETAIGGLDRIVFEGPEADWQRAVWKEVGEDPAALQRRILARVRESIGMEMEE